ncbi:MAG: LacI family DNA-binding transcriptional regulator [Sphaerochaeta sp.]
MTVREIAKLAGVSPATVSLVINNKPGVGDTKRMQVQKLIKELGYSAKQKSVSSDIKKNLLFLKIIKIGFLVDQNSGFINRIMDSIQEECNKCGYTLQIYSIYDNYEKQLKELDYSQYDGIFLIGTEINETDYKGLDYIKKPFIVLDNSMPFYDCNTITMDNELMIINNIKYLSSTQETDFGYFRSSFNSQNFLERKRGVNIAVKRFNLQFDSKREFLLAPTLKDSYEGMKKYIEEGRYIPKIVCADNDIIAIGAMNALKEKGYRIPEDVSIIGFDDTFLAETNNPPLTTNHVQRTVIGKLATKRLIDQIKENSEIHDKTTVSGQLIIRKSVLNKFI